MKKFKAGDTLKLNLKIVVSFPVDLKISVADFQRFVSYAAQSYIHERIDEKKDSLNYD